MPSTYIMCEKDQALYPPVQEWVIASCKLPSEILRLDAGHAPYLSMPETVAAIVRRAAGEENVDILSLLIKSNNFADENLVDQLLTFLAAG